MQINQPTKTVLKVCSYHKHQLQNFYFLILLIGFPQDDIMVYEFYNTKSQTEARCHPALIKSQKFLLNLLSKSDPNSEISLQTLISYYDRLRIRKAGDR